MNNKSKEKKFSFIIVSPRQHHGGCIVLHLLCKLLIDSGYDAKIFYSDVFPEKRFFGFWFNYFRYFFFHDLFKLLRAKICIKKGVINDEIYNGYIYEAVKGCPRKWSPFFKKRNTIIVYPEVIFGNPLKAKYVVRWFLSFDKYPNNQNAYGLNDLKVFYRDVFYSQDRSSEKNILFLSFFDKELYKKYNMSDREGNAYILRKGRNRLDLPKEFDGPIIDDYNEQKKVEILNQCKYCISYDTQSFYSTIAAICGAISVVVPEPDKVRSDYLKEDDEVYGVAFGFSEDEINYAKNTVYLIEKSLEEKEERNIKNVLDFIKLVNNYFNK